MKKMAVIIDIDNTLVDTVYRKHSIITSLLPQDDVQLSTVRKDYHLKSITGLQNGETYKEFCEILESVDGIENHSAPLFDRALEAYNLLIKEGLEVLLITGRPEKLRKCTVSELESLGIAKNTYTLFMRETGQLSTDESEQALEDYKLNLYIHALAEYEVIAAVGDRPEDIHAANTVHIFAVLFRSTTSREESEKLASKDSVGFSICDSWNEVIATVIHVRKGRDQMDELRNSFSSQYSNWLSSIDNKCQIVVQVAAILSTLLGILLKNSNEASLKEIVLACSLLCCLGSILFAMRGYTARYTSGNNAGIPVSIRLKQALAVLLGRPENYMLIPGDAIDEYQQLRRSNDFEKTKAHLIFFQKRYNSHDPDALLNMRMYELRASNYSKLYAERIATKLLVLSLIGAVTWMAMEKYASYSKTIIDLVSKQ